VIYHNFPTEPALDRELARLKHEYEAHLAAKDLFQEVYNDRKKLCITYTRAFFTNGFVATVISEAKNSSMKTGNRKTKMKQYTMSDQCKMLMSWESHLDAKACDTIMSLLGREDYSARPWSDFVEAAFAKAILACQHDVAAIAGAAMTATASNWQ
jgi:hypothetical protein